MNVFQIIALVMKLHELFKSLVKNDQQTFGAKAQEFGLGGEWVQKLWENREAILAFVLQLIEMWKNKQGIIGAAGPESELYTLEREIRSQLASSPQVAPQVVPQPPTQSPQV